MSRYTSITDRRTSAPILHSKLSFANHRIGNMVFNTEATCSGPADKVLIARKLAGERVASGGGKLRVPCA